MKKLLLIAALLVVVPASAEEEVEEVEEADEEREAPLAPLPWDQPRDGEEGCTDEEILVLRDLRKRSLELDRREAGLDERQASLGDLEVQMGEELAKLEAMRAVVLDLMQQQKDQNLERIGALARVIDTMKAREAATMLAGMDEQIALEVLRKLKPKQAGKVLGAMPDRKAQRLGDRMTALVDPRTES